MILRSVAVVVAGLMVALRSLAAAHPIYQPRLRFRLRLQSDSRWPAHRPLPAALRPRLQYPARLQRRERPAHASILADCPMKSIFFRPLLARATPHGGASPHPSNAIPCPGPSSPRPGNSSSVSARWPWRSCAAGPTRSKPPTRWAWRRVPLPKQAFADWIIRAEPADSHQDTASNHSQAGTTSTAMPSTDNASR